MKIHVSNLLENFPRGCINSYSILPENIQKETPTLFIHNRSRLFRRITARRESRRIVKFFHKSLFCVPISQCHFIPYYYISYKWKSDNPIASFATIYTSRSLQDFRDINCSDAIVGFRSKEMRNRIGRDFRSGIEIRICEIFGEIKC